VDKMSDRVVLINNGYILAEGGVLSVREEKMEEHPMQILIRCDRPQEFAARVFASDSVVEAALHPDRQGLFIKTRNADAFYQLLNRVVVENGINVESVSPVDDDLNAVYHYLIGSNGGGS
jgi:ABC-2 type transport system ATP-binding protein